MNVVPLQQEIDLGEPQFDDWWILWLKKVKRKESKRLWSRLRNEQKMASIIAAAEWRPVWLARESEYWPDPVKWVEGERWEDEMPQGYQRTSAHQPFKPDSPGAYVPMPDHVKALIARLRSK